MDHDDFLPRFLDLLRRSDIRYCLIGGQAVNAYVSPLVSLDLDVVVAADDLARVEEVMAEAFSVERFPHSLNVQSPDSKLRVQIQTDPRYFDFVDRATLRDVLGVTVPVAAVDDLLRGKIWAFQDPTRRGSKRQKDLADIGRLVEAYPELRAQVPEDILSRLL